MNDELKKTVEDLWKLCINGSPHSHVVVRASDLAAIIMALYEKESDNDKQ